MRRWNFFRFLPNKFTLRSYSYFYYFPIYELCKKWFLLLCQVLHSLVKKTQGILGDNNPPNWKWRFLFSVDVEIIELFCNGLWLLLCIFLHFHIIYRCILLIVLVNPIEKSLYLDWRYILVPLGLKFTLNTRKICKECCYFLTPKILSDQIWVLGYFGQPLTYPEFTISSFNFLCISLKS
jgi:hypothetical protein